MVGTNFLSRFCVLITKFWTKKIFIKPLVITSSKYKKKITKKKQKSERLALMYLLTLSNVMVRLTYTFCLNGKHKINHFALW